MLTLKETMNFMAESPYSGDAQGNLFKSSWAINPGFRHLQEKLDELVPFQGKVPHSRSKNKALEKFRVASNLTYDLFNNGLGNRRNQFGSFFGWAPYTRGGMTNSQFEEAERKLEPVITRIIIDAAKEQGIS
tara:strand:+ start:658 stop:1053 length:396 start_codon:yes stop_codon:yes gene_type:complete